MTEDVLVVTVVMMVEPVLRVTEGMTVKDVLVVTVVMAVVMKLRGRWIDGR